MYAELLLAAGMASGTGAALRVPRENRRDQYSCCDLEWTPARTVVVDSSLVCAVSIDGHIDRIVSDASYYEQGDELLSQKPIQELKELLKEAEQISGQPIQLGDVIPCNGELSMTWHRNDAMLMITTFPDARPPRLDFGSTPAVGMGEYRSDPAANGEKLANHLTGLFRQVNQQGASVVGI